MKNFLFLSLVVTFFLIPFEGAEVFLFGMPIYLVEIGVMVSAVTLVLVQKRERGMTQFVGANNYSPVPKCNSPLPTPIRWGIAFLLFGIISSTLVALSNQSTCPLSHEGFLRALGIIKSWFVIPMLFGYIIFYASRVYFSREKLIFLFMVSFLPFGIFSLLMWIFGSGMTYDGRFEGIFNSPNTLAMYLTPAAILSWYFFRKYSFAPQTKGEGGVTSQSVCETTLSPLLVKARRNTFWISFFIFAFLLFLTRSYSAWIAIFLGLFFFEIVRIRNIRARANYILVGANNYSPLRYAGIILVFAGIIAFSQWNNPRFEHFFDPGSRSSFASRVMIWQSAGKMVVDSPVFGIGPGNFQACYLAYQKYFPPYLEWSVPEPHNIFLAFWLGGGIIGLLGCGFLVFWWFRNVFQNIKKEGGHLLLTLAAIMIAMLVHGLVDTPYWRISLSYIFWWVFFMGISSSSLQEGAPRTRGRGVSNK